MLDFFEFSSFLLNFPRFLDFCTNSFQEFTLCEFVFPFKDSKGESKLVFKRVKGYFITRARRSPKTRNGVSQEETIGMQKYININFVYYLFQQSPSSRNLKKH